MGRKQILIVGSSGGASGTVTNVTGTANQIDVATGTTTPVISLDAAITLPGTINKVTITAPTTAATIAFGTDNTTQTFQGSDTIVGRATTDTLTNKSIQLAQITSPTAAPPTLAVGDNPIIYNAASTTAGRVVFTVGETTASTSTGAPVGLRATTLIGSTAIPLSVDNSLNGAQTIPAVSITPTWNTSGVVNGALLVNPTNTGSGALSKLIVAQASNVTKWSVDKGGIVAQGGVTGTYSGVATASGGLACIRATADVTGKATNQTITTLYTPTATGHFRVSCYLKVTRAATTSSILGTGTTNGVIITFTDGTDSVAQSITMPMFSETGALVAAATGNTGNATSSSLNGSIFINALTAVAIQFTIGYTSVGGTTMQYEAHLKAEELG